MGLIIVYYLILIILKNEFLILSEGDTIGINGSFGAPGNYLILLLVKQRQNFVWLCIIIMLTLIYL